MVHAILKCAHTHLVCKCLWGMNSGDVSCRETLAAHYNIHRYLRTCTLVIPPRDNSSTSDCATFPGLCVAPLEADMPDDRPPRREKLRQMLGERTKQCPVTWRTEDGRGTWRCGLEEGHDGEHEGLGTGNSLFVRRIAERISDNLCVRDGAVAWKSSENNKIQGWDDSIKVLQELIAEVLEQERYMAEVADKKYSVQKKKPRKSPEIQ